ncbi:MAG: TauD/TfdA family dioxygenase [Porticoccaceae bacterium]|nr:TauD/TfdA family dioxygenase [Porticoccaceae bacterium]MDG1312224.1 TauD/TfdA family dioxygenase [Porticoccaceae bacterium]
MNVKLIAGALGAEISDIDLTGEVSADDYQAIRALLVEHEVIFFRNQNVSPAQQHALASSFGPLQTHPAYATVPGFPEITILESTADKPSKIECWHSDMTFRQHPPMGTVLRSKVIPEKGGDTMWSSMTSAYDGLSSRMQAFLNDLNAGHDFSYGFKESLAEEGGRERLASAVADNPPVIHPVIRTHPESGKKIIFVNPLFTTHIIGLPADESRAILQFLYQHNTTLEFTCRFGWDVDCIAIWDNRSTQHKPINDYFPAYRSLERIVIDGDKPF